MDRNIFLIANVVCYFLLKNLDLVVREVLVYRHVLTEHPNQVSRARRVHLLQLLLQIQLGSWAQKHLQFLALHQVLERAARDQELIQEKQALAHQHLGLFVAQVTLGRDRWNEQTGESLCQALSEVHKELEATLALNDAD